MRNNRQGEDGLCDVPHDRTRVLTGLYSRRATGAGVLFRGPVDKTIDLVSAVQNGILGKVEALIADRVDVNRKEHDEYSPLHVACGSKNPDPRIVAALLAAGAQVSATGSDEDNCDGTPLAITLGHLADGAYYEDQEKAWEIVDLLLAELVNLEGEGEIYLLKEMATQNATEVVRKLLEEKGFGVPAQVNYQDYEGMTALMSAVLEENEEVVKLLIDVPVIDVKLADVDGDTALHLAVKKGHLGIVSLLAVKDPIMACTVNEEGMTPLMLAKKEECQEMVEAMEKNLQVYTIIKGNPGGKRGEKRQGLSQSRKDDESGKRHRGCGGGLS